MSSDNPFFKKRPSIQGGKDAPIIARLPQHFFSSFEGLKKELFKHEACIALIPNTKSDKDFPFAYHAAFAYKDGTNRVYTMVLTQHDGQLKDDPTEAIEKIVKATQQPPKKNKKKNKKKKRRK